MRMILLRMKMVLLGIVAFLGIALISYSGVSGGGGAPSMKLFIAGFLLLVISIFVFCVYDELDEQTEFRGETFGGDGDD